MSDNEHHDKLFKSQHEFFKACMPDTYEEFVAFSAGYGTGKSRVGSRVVGFYAASFPGIRCGVYTISYDLLKLNLIPVHEELFADWGIKYKLNKTDNVMTLENGTEIIFRSLDNPARIVGYETHLAWLDEIDVYSEDKATEAYQKTYARNRGRYMMEDGSRLPNKMLFTSTPEGFRWMWKTFKKNPTDKHRLIKGKTTENKTLGPSYVETMKAIYPSNLVDAYINGEFVNLTSGAVYYAFNRQDCDVFNLEIEDANVAYG